MHKKQFQVVLGLSAFLLAVSSSAVPVFAGNDQDSMHDTMHEHMMNRSTDTHDWKKNWNWNFWEDKDRNLMASLKGENEVPGPGDSDGYGTAKVRVKPGKEEVCVELSVHNLDTTTAAHIHKGAKGVAGPVIVPLPTPDAQGMSKGCVAAAKDVLKDMKNNSSQYYVNVHTTAYPDGAVRGQLDN